MTRLLLGFFCAFALTFTVGCGGGSTESTVIEADMSEADVEQEADDYEAEMEDDTVEGDG